MQAHSFIIKGNICFSKTKDSIATYPDSYAVCIEGKSVGVFSIIPEQYLGLPIRDFGSDMILPGLVDLHIHAPQYGFRGLGMDLELLDWLDKRAFPEEAKFSDLVYAKEAYSIFADEIRKSASTRLAIFGTRHREATKILMEEMEKTGVQSYVGKVNMDRNAPDFLREEDATVSAEQTVKWLEETANLYQYCKPILTPRFIPSCTDELLRELSEIQQKYDLPLQSHLSENLEEISWVKELCPDSDNYGDAYYKRNLFGGVYKTIMAHCVYSDLNEIAQMKKQGVFIAHCPQSNLNLASGIAPVRTFLEEGLQIGLGSDVAGGYSHSIFRAMADAIQMSKIRWRLVDQKLKPLSLAEAFYLGTLGGGAFFGKVGSLEAGYEFDAVVLEDTSIKSSIPLTLEERLERIVYLSNETNIVAKFVSGRQAYHIEK